MKAFVTSLTAGVLLCILILSRNGLAQQKYNCLDFEGCPNDQCSASDDQCPISGTAINYEMDITATVWSCVPAEAGPCQNTDYLPYCHVKGYRNMTDDMCTGFFCPLTGA